MSSARFSAAWAQAVLGRPYQDVRSVAGWEIELLALALAAEPDRPAPPLPPAPPAGHPQLEHGHVDDQREADRAAWRALRERLPVPVTVGHNWTMVHLGYSRSGRDHIVVQAELRVGRLRRALQEALCETPGRTKARARNGTSRDPLRGLDRHDDGHDRVPTCTACLRLARRLVNGPGPARLVRDTG